MAELQKCPKCSKTFPDNNDLEVHLFSCKPPKEGCLPDKEAKEKRNKKFNVIETSKGKFYPCHHCTMVFRLSCARSTHMKRVHEKRRPHKCDTCGYAFYRPNDLMRHKRTHTGEKPYNCHACDKGFALPKTLEHHVQEHLEENVVFLENGQKRYNCSACPEDFEDGNALEAHLILLSSKSETKRDSPEVKEKLNRKFNIIETSKGKVYPCLHCNKVFTGPTARSTHTRRVHAESRPHKCDTCGRAFYASKDLSIHQRTHTGEKPYSCQHCNVSFSVSSSLRRHVKSVHLNPDEKGNPIQPGAPICAIPAQHMIKNTGFEPHECDLCGDSFSERMTLGSHVRKIHSEPNVYPCRFCEKSCSNDGALRSHLRTHAEDLYICSACSYSTYEKDSLKKHEKTHAANGELVQTNLTPWNSSEGSEVTVKSETETCFTCELCPCPKYFTDTDDLEAHLMSCHNMESANVMDESVSCGEGQETKYEQSDDSGKEGGIEDMIKAELIPEETRAQTGGKQCLDDSCKSQNRGYSGYKNVQEKLNTKFSIIETSKGKFYPCHYCSKVFTGSTTRSTHTRRIHEKSRPHKCETCGRAFYNPRELTSHSRTHTGEKPYNCRLCESNFTHDSSLRRHMRTIHPNLDAISCHVEAEYGMDESRESVSYELSSYSTDRDATLKRKWETTDCIVKRGEMVVLPRFGFILDGKMLFAKALHKGKEGTRNYLCKKCATNFRSDEELCVHYSRHHKLPTVVIQKL